jgi:hypothetical protein
MGVGGENEVCILHGELSREVSQQNKDIGKVSERLGRVEENTKCLPEILETLKALNTQKATSAGFIAGVAFIISGIMSAVGVVVSIWFSRGHGP